MTTDYLALVFASIPASIGVGIGISFGQDAYKWMKEKIKAHKLKKYYDEYLLPNQKR